MTTAESESHITVDSSHEVDTNYDEGFEDNWSHYTTESLTSSIYEYRYENGRRYHAYAEGSYPLPNDEREQDRLDIIHHMSLLADDHHLLHCPVEHPSRILDVGTGTGIWAIDAGDMYPGATVVGTDLSPIQPSWMPPNVEFQIDDAELQWCWSSPFDIIHFRCLNGSIGNWQRFFKNAYRSLTPGGYIDIDEYPVDLFCDDGTLKPDSPVKKWYNLFNEAAVKFGKNVDVEGFEGMLKEVGFVDVSVSVQKLPMGPWVKDKKWKQVGSYLLMQGESAFESYGIQLFTKVLGMGEEEAKRVCKTAATEVRDRKVHAYGKRFVIYARKPEEDE